MKNSDLDKILKSGGLPQQPPEYWEEFPKKISRQLDRPGGATDARARRVTSERERSAWASVFRFKFAFPAITLAAACAIVLLLTVHPPAQTAGAKTSSRESLKSATHQKSDSRELVLPELTQAQKYYREIEALFPNQVRAIVFDQHGPHLILADKASVPDSRPVFLKICGLKGCERFVTFSGQQIPINGQMCDVLLDRNGGVILAGQNLLWSTATGAETSSGLRIAAEPLGNRS